MNIMFKPNRKFPNNINTYIFSILVCIQMTSKTKSDGVNGEFVHIFDKGAEKDRNVKI
jgi:hypothetical protein